MVTTRERHVQVFDNLHTAFHRPEPGGTHIGFAGYCPQNSSSGDGPMDCSASENTACTCWTKWPSVTTWPATNTPEPMTVQHAALTSGCMGVGVEHETLLSEGALSGS